MNRPAILCAADTPAPIRVAGSVFAGLLHLLSVCLPRDAMFLKLVSGVVLWDKPRARRHLRQYLAGSGRTVHIDTAQVLSDDRGVRVELFRQVYDAIAECRSAGSVRISQLTYTHSDWRAALGGMTLRWRLEDGRVHVELKSRYCWRPWQKRITQPVHRAAARMQMRGAAAFDIVGRSSVIDLPRKLVPTGRHQRFYM